MSEFRAKSYFGQGVKFNGVDQNISGIPSTLVNGDSFSILATFAYSGNTSQCIVGNFWTQNSIGVHSNGHIRVHINTSSQPSSGIRIISSTLAVTGQVYMVGAVVDSGNYVKVYINGILDTAFNLVEADVTTHLADSWEIGSGGNATGKCNYAGKDIYIFKDVLTPTQIKYQYEYPETFLYREDGVLKSKILTQVEIDNVVAYLPMCEKDNYVRDLVSYSEGEELSNTMSTNNSSSTNGVYIEGNSSIYPLNTLLLLKNTTTNEHIGTGTIIENSGGNFIRVSFSYNRIINNYYSITELSGTYPISNYTTSCRDNAKNLSTGLQTSKWKRDSLGVPYALSDYLECDGLGYLDTGLIIPTNEDFTVEAISYFDGRSDIEGHGSRSNPKCEMDQRSGKIYMFIGNTHNGGVTVAQAGYHHLAINYNYTSSTATYYINAVGIEKTNTTITDGTASMYIGSKNAGNRSAEESILPIRLFKVHNKAMTPQEVKYRYDKHVANGLLN